MLFGEPVYPVDVFDYQIGDILSCRVLRTHNYQAGIRLYQTLLALY